MQIRRVVVTTLAAAVLVAPGPGAAALGAANVPADIPAEMTAVVAARFAPAIGADTHRLDADTAAATAAQSRQADDQAIAAGADAAVARATTAVATAVATLSAATATSSADAAAVADDHRRLGAIALELYTDPAAAGAGADGAGGGPALDTAQSGATAAALLGVVTDGERHQLDADVTAAASAARAVTAATDQLATDRRTLTAATTFRDDRARLLAADAAAVTSTAAQVGTDRATLASDTAAQAAAVVAVAQPPGAPADGSPTILGGAALTAGQIASWFRARGDVDLTTAPIEQLAAWYVDEGAAEGVRGDVAFAQAMVETGGFESDDAVRYDNFAGIGHCDACATGAAFPGPLAGVRGQIQLLRTYATPGLTAAMLAAPPVIPAVVPETDPVRGCCVTFQALTGHWASDPLYGYTVMTVYQSMLASALHG